jgi:hypothetical protein
MLRNSIPMNRRHIIIAVIIVVIILAIIWRECSRLPEKIVSPTHSNYSARPSRSINPKSNKEPDTKEEYETMAKEKASSAKSVGQTES